MKLPSWIELHGALTHFPIALLFVAILFDVVAVITRKQEWRHTSLALLGLTVVSCIPALLTGYMVGRTFRYPPVGFQQHWIAAVVTAVLALLLLVWRLAARDNLSALARGGAFAVLLLGAGTVSYTGYLGGQMVFGGSDDAPPEATATPAPTPDNGLGAAAGKLEDSAGKLDAATDKLAQASARVASPTPSVQPPAPPANPQSSEPVAARLERAADRYDAVAQKLEGIANRLGSDKAVVPATAKPLTRPNDRAIAPIAAPDSASTIDSGLIAVGEKAFRSDDNGCLSCHRMNGQGGRIGPDLTHEGLRHPADWQIAHLIDPKSRVPGSSMPKYDTMSAGDLRAMAAYLESRR